jgi:site-specific DNA recombinase
MSRRKENVVPAADPTPKVVRCAAYTRKSTEEGLQQAFNTLDAQREAAAAFVAAQRHEGWTLLSERYDDGGYSGGSIDRPALRRLLADVAAGKVDCVVVYKVDRLSRSLLDFARVMGVLDAAGASFVSVTQPFNTAQSMGRLTLNVLLSFAQFEREVIGERTRDKIAAARRRGKYAGGRPPLGYDAAGTAAGGKLAVNEAEAARVRGIFALYLEHQALLPVVRELARRGWGGKAWTTRQGVPAGGRPIDKGSLYQILTNRTYAGVVVHKGTAYPGEHEAVVDPAVFDRVQGVLARNGKGNGGAARNRHGALLRGLLACGPCGCGMSHTYSTKGSKRYRYYVCGHAQRNGWDACPSKSVPAGPVEAHVVDQVRRAAADPAVLAATIGQARRQHERAVADLRAEQRRLQRELTKHVSAARAAVAAGDPARAAEAERRVEAARAALGEAAGRVNAAEAEAVSDDEVAGALAAFDPAWDQLTPRERERVVRLLVQRVDYDGAAGTVAVTFRPAGIKALAAERREQQANTEAA